MLILLLPLTTICVALAGFYVWHRQLIRKRLFEVAEAGLSAFSHAEAAVAYARRPIHEAGEGSSRKRAADELPASCGRAAYELRTSCGRATLQRQTTQATTT